MAVIMEEPNKDGLDLRDWDLLVERTTSQGGGFMLADWTEKQSTGIPQILKGSRFELNGAYYEVESNETIKNWENITDNKWCYVYLRALGDGLAEFFWSITEPTLQVEKGGLYYPDGNERAILSARKISATVCRAKSLVGRYGKQYPVPTDTNGDSLGSYTANTTINIKVGWYKLTLIGGRGGNGGGGGASGTFTTVINFNVNSYAVRSSSGISGFSGLTGNNGIPKTFYVWLEEGTLEIKVGRTGSAGTAGAAGGSGSTDNGTTNSGSPTGNTTTKGSGSGGKGGNGADGEETAVFNNGRLVAFAKGGDGGSGGMGSPGQYGFYGFTWQTEAQAPTNTTYMIGTRPTKGSNGADGDGFSANVTGSAQIYIL